MLKNRVHLWIESYLFAPTLLQRALSLALLPLSIPYISFVTINRFFAKKNNFSIPIISVGNLIVGGSGKTPFIQSLVADYEKPAIILRGYKRSSRGLKIVSLFGDIKADLSQSGDEAMLYALTCKNALVIVSEDRAIAIKEAKSLGAKVVFLDDGFSKAYIDKFDILLESNRELKNTFCLPSGPFRELKYVQKYANIVAKEEEDFERVVSVKDATKDMVFVTAIANAQRVEKYLPNGIIDKKFFPDHHNFSKDELYKILKQTKATSLLVTRKDWVKVKDFNIPLSFLELTINIKPKVKKKIEAFVENYKKFNNV